MKGHRAAWAAISLLLAPAARGEPADFFAQPSLTAGLTRIFNESDAEGLHRLLAPELRDLHPVPRLARTLALCRALTQDILRLGPASFPSMGARNVGFFTAEAETGLFELVIEVDGDGFVTRLLLSDNLDAPDQQCLVGPR
ncbi:hypothetical protein [Salinarimonas soli]|uniref:DUF3887 domain-containing protein n=1 Tax=Salinarimonas soli TaxID=1638099 RepID=A0A5B2VAI4_9HYPH|nr:hypothetical protein [Salinarimonas soli]KAA2235806.1 hypothetical protein F0L46_18465 [Salinarimonas soli]